MEKGEKAAALGKKHCMQKNERKKEIKFGNTTRSTSSKLPAQPTRRSGRIANLNWKSLREISSETKPIILSSDSSDADIEDEKLDNWGFNKTIGKMDFYKDNDDEEKGGSNKAEDHIRFEGSGGKYGQLKVARVEGHRKLK